MRSQPPVSTPFMEPVTATARCEVITRQSHSEVHANELPRVSHNDLMLAQKNHPDISRVIGRKPTPAERTHEHVACLLHLRQWDKLQLKEGMLYRVKKTSYGSTSQQLVLPQQYRTIVMKGLHNALAI